MTSKFDHLTRKHHIQNVYCATNKLTVEACFLNDELKYTVDNSPLLIEVPFDQYDAVITAFQERLGESTNPKNIIKQGAFTYAQVYHIASSGNIHHLEMDDEGRIDFIKEDISISVAITFAQSKWNGAIRKAAIENAVCTGLTIYGETFAEDVLEKFLEKVESTEIIEMDGGVSGAMKSYGTHMVEKKMAMNVTKSSMVSSVAAKKENMMSSANVVTDAFVTGMMSTVEIARAIKSEMSSTHLLKNTANTVASVGGGIAGSIIGCGIGLTIPNVSTIIVSLIGGIIGLIIGSILASKLTKKVLDFFIPGDLLQMIEIFDTQLALLAMEYMLNEQELHQALTDFNTIHDMRDQLRTMYATEDRKKFANNLIDSELSRIVKLRMYLHVPTNEEFYDALKAIEV